MSSDDHKFPFLNNNSESNKEDESDNAKSSENNESQDGEQELLPWQKKSFGNKRKSRNDRSSDRNDREDKGDRRSFGDRKEITDRPSWGNKDRKDDRSTDKGSGDDRGERRSFVDRKEITDRPSWGNKDRKDDRSTNRRSGDDRGDRRSFGDRKESTDRPSWGNKDRKDDRSNDQRDGDERGEKRSFGNRKESADRPSWGNKDRKDDRSTNRRSGDDRGERRSFGDRKESTDRPSWGNKDRKDDRSNDQRDGDERGERRSFGKEKEEKKPWGGKDRKDDLSKDRNRDVKPWGDRREYERSGFGTNDDMRRYDDRDNEIKPVRIQSTKSKTFNDFADFYLGDQNENVSSTKDSTTEKPKADFNKPEKAERKRIVKDTDREFGRRRDRPEKTGVSINYGEGNEDAVSVMRLNKYIAKTGLCSRRKAADLVKDGEITVNGNIEVQPAYEVQDTDVILYQGRKLEIQEELVYLLLNKPKGYITTMDDERDRKTVMDLIEDKVDVRVFPVGRLDRNTSGLLLFTNDGDLTKVLSHPSHKVQKFYHVVLDKPVSETHIEQIKEGLILEDGMAEVDAVGYVDGKGKDEVGIEIHIGKNRIVRRIFEHFGYRVEKLDRTYYAGLTKKDLSRGWSRHLTHKEVIMLKHFTGK